jgi:hypothetical protein
MEWRKYKKKILIMKRFEVDELRSGVMSQPGHQLLNQTLHLGHQ